MKGRRLPLISYDDTAADNTTGVGLRVHAVSAERYGVLKSVRVEFGDHVVLVGGNASGKSTLLDVFSFISDAVASGVSAAIEARASGFEQLVWFGEGDAFAFAVEFNIPPALRGEHSRARYELEVGRLEESGVGVRAEALYLCHRESPPRALIQSSTPRGWRKVLGSIQGGQVRFGTEQAGSRKATNAQVSGDRLGLV
jgi:energy-coupling factor transporter ATP-binding protein EcfA2